MKTLQSVVVPIRAVYRRTGSPSRSNPSIGSQVVNPTHNGSDNCWCVSAVLTSKSDRQSNQTAIHCIDSGCLFGILNGARATHATAFQAFQSQRHQVRIQVRHCRSRITAYLRQTPDDTAGCSSHILRDASHVGRREPAVRNLLTNTRVFWFWLKDISDVMVISCFRI
jgi:hypothetical protein